MSSARRIAAFSLLVVGELSLAVAVTRAPRIAVLVCVLAMFALTLFAPGTGVALALASSFFATRVGGGSIDLSASDAYLVAALAATIPRLSLPRRAAIHLVVAGVYLAGLALTVAAHPYRASILEWAHRSVMTAGAIVVGATIARHQRIRFALRSLLVIATAVTLVAMVDTIASGFGPAYPFGLHKNFAGAMLAMCSIVCIAAPNAIGLIRPLPTLLFALFTAGVLATQSRASLVGVAAALAVVGFRRGGRSPVRVLNFAATLTGLIAVSVASLRAATSGANNTQFNSIRSRETVYRVAYNVFRENPLFGAGLRWFKLSGPGRTAYLEPHSMLFATLSEAGAWGLISIGFLFGATILLLRRRRGELATLCLAVLTFRLTQGQFDVFWVAGTMTLPWLLVGIAAASEDVETNTFMDTPIPVAATPDNVPRHGAPKGSIR